jgi:hypothetical protein
MPCWASAAHMAGSQDTMASPLTWPATQATASSRVAEAAVTEGTVRAGASAEARCGAARARPASTASATDTAASASATPRRRRLGPWRGAGPATRVSSAA